MLENNRFPRRYKEFKNFMRDVFVELYGWGEPTWVQNAIADCFQYGSDRLIVQAYRGCGKSSILQCYSVWCLMVDPMLNLLITSETSKISKNFTAQLKRIITQFKPCQWLTPEDDQPNEAYRFYVKPNRITKDYSVESSSITGSMTGLRANIIIADDTETARNSITLEQRQKVSHAFEEFSSILSSEGRGRIIVLGTPHSHDSIYLGLEKKGYECVVFPVEYPTPERLAKYGDRIHPLYLEHLENGAVPGTPADPERLDEVDLAKKKTEFRPQGYNLQFLLDTSLSDELKYPLKLKDLVVMDLDMQLAPARLSWSNSPDNKWRDLSSVGFGFDSYYRPLIANSLELIPYDTVIMSIDPSGRGKDEMGVCILKVCSGRIFLSKAIGLRNGYDKENLVLISKLAKLHGVNKIIYESNFGDGMFGEILKPILNTIHPCAIEEVRNHQRKEVRIIDTLEPVMQQHRLVVSREVIQDDLEDINKATLAVENALSYSLFYQLTRITRDKGCLAHDDRLDALAIGVGFLTKHMAIDSDKMIPRRLHELREEDYKKTMTSFNKLDLFPGGSRAKTPNWADGMK